jgi:hypothetical protein
MNNKYIKIKNKIGVYSILTKYKQKILEYQRWIFELCAFFVLKKLTIVSSWLSYYLQINLHDH